jgi:hypothetical protein
MSTLEAVRWIRFSYVSLNKNTYFTYEPYEVNFTAFLKREPSYKNKVYKTENVNVGIFKI